MPQRSEHAPSSSPEPQHRDSSACLSLPRQQRKPLGCSSPLHSGLHRLLLDSHWSPPHLDFLGLSQRSRSSPPQTQLRLLLKASPLHSPLHSPLSSKPLHSPPLHRSNPPQDFKRLTFCKSPPKLEAQHKNTSCQEFHSGAIFGIHVLEDGGCGVSTQVARGSALFSTTETRAKRALLFFFFGFLSSLNPMSKRTR